MAGCGGGFTAGQRRQFMAYLRRDDEARLAYVNDGLVSSGRDPLKDVAALHAFEAVFRAKVRAAGLALGLPEPVAAGEGEDDGGTGSQWCAVCCAQALPIGAWFCTLSCDWFGAGCACCDDEPAEG